MTICCWKDCQPSVDFVALYAFGGHLALLPQVYATFKVCDIGIHHDEKQ